MTTPALAHRKPIPAAVPATLAKRDLISMSDLSPQELVTVLDLASAMKAYPAQFRKALDGKQLVLFFEKPSLRTRLTFEAGMNSLGGVSFFVDQGNVRLGEREPICDMGRNLERWVDGVVLRTYSHDTVTQMAEHADIPVINALSDFEHPCQALADLLTLQEKFGNLTKVKLAYVGDGNNVAHSLMLGAAAAGAKIVVATPDGYEPDGQILADSRQIAARTGATVDVTNDPLAAVTGADAIYTDVWASMGQESEADERKRIFAPYQVNDTLMSLAAKRCIFMHCLPAHRGDEVTASVIESPRSVVFDQAENRLHVQKAILMLLMGSGEFRFPKKGANV